MIKTIQACMDLHGAVLYFTTIISVLSKALWKCPKKMLTSQSVIYLDCSSVGKCSRWNPKFALDYLKVLWWLLGLMETLLTARYLWRWCNTHLHTCIVCLCGSEHRWPLLWSFFSFWLLPTRPFSIMLFSISSSLSVLSMLNSETFN